MGEEDSKETTTVEEDLSPASAFELVAHETRVGVLEALLPPDGGPLSFGEIRDAVGVEDPGQCHYHVDRLRDQFIRKSDEGYVLSPAGWQLAGAIVSGGVTASLPSETVPADGSCSQCEGDLAASLRDAGVTIECTDCGFVTTNPDIPPAILGDWPREEIPRVVGRYLNRLEISAAHGFCPNCNGRVDRTVAAPGEEAAPDWFDGGEVDATVVTECRRCGFWWHAAVPIAALAEPAVVAFHHEHGIDLRERPWWTLDHVEVGRATLSEEPRKLDVPMTIDGDTRTFVFDESFSLVEERRE